MGIVIKSTHTQLLQITESVAAKEKVKSVKAFWLQMSILKVCLLLWEIKACLIEAHFHTISWCSSHFRHFQIIFYFLVKYINLKEKCFLQSHLSRLLVSHIFAAKLRLERWKKLYIFSDCNNGMTFLLNINAVIKKVVWCQRIRFRCW